MQAPYLTKHELMKALLATPDLAGSLNVGGTYFRTVLSVEREDGSGKSFNVTGYNVAGEKMTIHCYTID